MEDTTQHIEVNGKMFLVMSKELFDLRIKAAYTNGELNAYQRMEATMEAIK